MKKFQHINFIVSTVCECRLELLTLHDLFPCGKAGKGGGGGGGGVWRPVQERLAKDPDLVWTLF